MRKFLLTLTLLVLAGGLLAGCTGQVTAPDIIQHMKDTAAKTQDVHLVMDINATMTDTSSPTTSKESLLPSLPTSGKATIELWYQAPNLMRAEVRSVDPSTYQGATFVNDGQALWGYDPSHNMVYKLNVSALQGAGQMLNMPTDLQQLLNDPNLAGALDKVLSLTDAKLDGNEAVAGFQTYKLTLTPKADTGLANAALGAQVTMWVDQATWVVVKLDVTSTKGTFSYSAQSLDFNKGVDAAKFKFTQPPGAKGIDLTMLAPRPTTLDEARTAAAKTGFTLLTPNYVPAGATLTAVTAMPMGRGYLLTYSGSTANFLVYEGLANSKMPFGGQTDAMAQMMNGEKPAGAQVQTVPVRGVQGTAFTHQADATGAGAGREGSVVTWQEANSTLSVGIGGDLPLAETLKIAESLK